MKHGTTTGHNYHGCRCGECRRAKVEHVKAWRKANPDKVRAANRRSKAAYREYHDSQNARYRAEYAELTKPFAINSWRPWSKAEVAIALDRSLTVVEAALAIGRTADAVTTARRNYRGKEMKESA